MSQANNTLNSSAQRVQKALNEKGLDFEVKELTSSTRTASDAALTLGCEIGQIVKSLLFCTQKQLPILILVSGANRVNENAIEKWVGEKVVKADADYTRNATGFAIGGVPPIGHHQPIQTIIDEDLCQYEILWAAAGTPHAVFCLSPTELESITGGKVIAIK